MPESATRQADLAEERRQRDAHPHRLLAVLGALQPPAHRDERAPFRHAAGEAAQRVRGDAADRLGPLGRLGLPVGVAEHVRDEPVAANRVALDELGVVQALGHDHVREREHRRDIGPGHDRVPGRVDVGWQVAAQRTEQLEGQAPAASLGEARRERVPGDATGAHPRVLQVHAAERHDELGVLEDRLPRGRPPQHLAGCADDVRQDHLRGAERVAVDGARVATDAVQEPVQLTLRVVEAPGARPPVRATEDRLVAGLLADSAELVADELERVVPVDLHELVGSASVIRPWTMFEPTLANGRTCDARVVADAVEVVRQQR